MNKPAFSAIQKYSPDRPVLIFVSSRRQTRLTALDLIGLAVQHQETNAKLFLRNINEEQLSTVLNAVRDSTLKQTLEFGIGLHHAGIKTNFVLSGTA